MRASTLSAACVQGDSGQAEAAQEEARAAAQATLDALQAEQAEALEASRVSCQARPWDWIQIHDLWLVMTLYDLWLY